ncbi:centrosomal protein CEP44 [Pycnococcus provasolii]
MATGDLLGNVQHLRRELRHIRYPAVLDEALLKAGDPVALLPALHYVLLGFSRPLARYLADSGYHLEESSDWRFVESAAKLLREVFRYRPALTPVQFLSHGFAERKVLLVLDVIRVAKAKHNELLRQRHAAGQRSGGRVVSAVRASLNEDAAPTPKAKATLGAHTVVNAAAAAAAEFVPVPAEAPPPPTHRGHAGHAQPHLTRSVAPEESVRVSSDAEDNHSFSDDVFMAPPPTTTTQGRASAAPTPWNVNPLHPERRGGGSYNDDDDDDDDAMPSAPPITSASMAWMDPSMASTVGELQRRLASLEESSRQAQESLQAKVTVLTARVAYLEDALAQQSAKSTAVAAATAAAATASASATRNGTNVDGGISALHESMGTASFTRHQKGGDLDGFIKNYTSKLASTRSLLDSL